tara:strand:+ start:414 stop:1172 length:759 start_codon:yes stop_codon:yes gene_type:complete
MRSTFFEKNIQYQIEIDGEIWSQGQNISGELRLRNMSTSVVSLKSINLTIAHGVKKLMKEKNELGWEIHENLILKKNISLSNEKEESFKWSLNLKTDCPITDKNGGLFLLFGDENVLSKGGRIDLKIKLHPLLQNFLQTFTTQFRFLEKYQKRKDDWTEVKLLPPESKEFPNLDSVICRIRIKKEKIEVNYSFKMKGIRRSGQQMKITKKNREFIQTIEKQHYLLPGGFPNRICFRENIDLALNTARPEVIF